LAQYPLTQNKGKSFQSLIQNARQELQQNSVVALPNFLTSTALESLVLEALEHKHKAYYTDTTKSTHNVYLTQNDPLKPSTHIYNRQVVSSKGCITTDQIPQNSLIKSLYYNAAFREFLQQVLQIKNIYPYQDPLSSINVHYASEGQELGWHFDNSAFAITLLLQKPLQGGHFEYVPNLRHSDESGSSPSSVEEEESEREYKDVEGVLDGNIIPKRLDINPGTLVFFRGRDSLHRVTKVVGDTTRIIVILAYNEKEGIELSKEARMTFYGRIGI
jgi:hypothetical protein